MKQITQYKADDGKIFTNKSDCLVYDELIKKVNIIMKPFGHLPEDEDCSFANGGGYIKHKKTDVEKAKKLITALGNDTFNIKPKASFGWIGRYFDDSGYSCLYSAWGRLSNIDRNGREWGQGYYAINPDKGTQKQLN